MTQRLALARDHSSNRRENHRLIATRRCHRRHKQKRQPIRRCWTICTTVGQNEQRRVVMTRRCLNRNEALALVLGRAEQLGMPLTDPCGAVIRVSGREYTDFTRLRIAPRRSRRVSPNRGRTLNRSRRPSLRRSLRKEVIQPQVPLRLPCYDLVPVTSLAVDTTELWRLRALPAPMT